ncbi:hypothetical protein [Enterococcus faecalis]|uniref:hypothetical protein n=1 Tax=Enterococcus faecalis TaxID=1351 RepID=UPI00287FCE78|nr:hypothetical protein [Enterococcus faecalis]
MNTAILWNELKSSDPFLDLSKKIEIEYDVPKIGYNYLGSSKTIIISPLLPIVL